FLSLLLIRFCFFVFFFSSRRRHTRCYRDWSSDVCSSDLHARHPGRDDNLQRLLLRESLPNQRVVVILCERGEPIRILGPGHDAQHSFHHSLHHLAHHRAHHRGGLHHLSAQGVGDCRLLTDGSGRQQQKKGSQEQRGPGAPRRNWMDHWRSPGWQVCCWLAVWAEAAVAKRAGGAAPVCVTDVV